MTSREIGLYRSGGPKQIKEHWLLKDILTLSSLSVFERCVYIAAFFPQICTRINEHPIWMCLLKSRTDLREKCGHTYTCTKSASIATLKQYFTQEQLEWKILSSQRASFWSCYYHLLQGPGAAPEQFDIAGWRRSFAEKKGEIRRW